MTSTYPPLLLRTQRGCLNSRPNVKLSYSSTYEHHIVQEATGPFSEKQMCMGFTRATKTLQLQTLYWSNPYVCGLGMKMYDGLNAKVSTAYKEFVFGAALVLEYVNVLTWQLKLCSVCTLLTFSLLVAFWKAEEQTSRRNVNCYRILNIAV